MTPPKSTREPYRLQPLHIRPGAQYTCFGDGLCCTDIHGLGPITKPEYVQIRKIDKRGAAFDDDFEDYMLTTVADGGCRFLLPDQRCNVHATSGPEAKPDGCRRFPLGLVATPAGGRITTRHRCPCRTMGERPDLTGDSALPSLVEDGSPRSDLDITEIRIGKESIPFETWVEHEKLMLADLAKGVPPEDVLGAEPFPKLKKGYSWRAHSKEFIEAIDGSAFGFAVAFFGEAIRVLVGPKKPKSEIWGPRFPSRPWAAAFDRAERRPGTPRDEDAVFADWIADEIWSLEWSAERGWDIARAELATRLHVGRFICKWLIDERQCRPDRAAAEALMIIELVGESDFWTELLPQIRRSHLELHGPHATTA